MTFDERLYDARQINIMKEKISLFKEGKLNIRYLIDDLEALLGCLKTVDDLWKQKFLSEWWQLEETYAVAINENKKHLDNQDEEVVRQALDKIDMLILEKRQKE